MDNHPNTPATHDVITILGIETSCDETAAAVYNMQDGVLSNSIFSQVPLHTMYGGVVPEIASRSHLEKIQGIIKNALETAHKTLDDIDAIAITNTPGLPGSLLVGVCFGKALAWAGQKKIVGVNHIEGHIFSSCIEHKIPFPFLCLTASGGHTGLYIVNNWGDYTAIGNTLDDAAGEAFDKVAKLLELGYPGGHLLEKLAAEVNFVDFFHYPRSMAASLNFSFSGLKTAVLYKLVDQQAYSLEEKKLLCHSHELKQQVASSLLVCIGDIFEQKFKLALKTYPDIKALAFAGGVARNTYLRKRLEHVCAQHNTLFFTPNKDYCTDNAAMIAFVGSYKARQGLYDNFSLDIS